MSRTRIILIAIWLLVIAAAVADMIYEGRRAGAASAWPSVQGRVVESGISVSSGRRGGGHYDPDISYEYRVDGQVLHGRRIWIGSGIFYQSRDEAEEFMQPYAVGAPVRVFYNPDDPRDAALIIENLGPMMIFMILAGMIAIALTLYWPRLVAMGRPE
jgi:hypothetical protein